MLAGLYLSLFMYSGEYSTEYVERERLYLIRLRSGLRNLLPPGPFPYPFWHDETKCSVYQATNSVLLWVNPKTAKIVIGQFTERGTGPPVVASQAINVRYSKSGAAFEALIKAARDWEVAHWIELQLMPLDWAGAAGQERFRPVVAGA